MHPFAADRDAYYRSAGGDTVTVLRVGIAPNSDRANSRSSELSRGDATRPRSTARSISMRNARRSCGCAVRFVMVGGSSSKMARIARASTGVVAVAYGEFVNAEVDGKYWLPAFQRTEFQASFPALGQMRPIFRLVSNIGDIAVSSGTPLSPADSAYSPRVIISWAPADSVNHVPGSGSAASERRAARCTPMTFSTLRPTSGARPVRPDSVCSRTARVESFGSIASRACSPDLLRPSISEASCLV